MDRVAALLKQFPGPLTLKVSKWKWLGTMAAGALIATGSIGYAINAEDSSAIWGWFGGALLGIGILAATTLLFLGHFDLTLNVDGFTARTGLRSDRWRWVEVSDFAVGEKVMRMRGSALKHVGFNDKRADRDTLTRVSEHAYTAMTGHNCSLPDSYSASSYGLPVEDLVRLMSLWQERALALNANRPATSFEALNRSLSS